MKIFFGADHAGFPLKETLKAYVLSLGHEVEDCGAYTLDMNDDYPAFIRAAAEKVAENPEHSRGIVIGASGQGEAIVANRVAGVRAALFYGEPAVAPTDAGGKTLDMISSVRNHNDANVLSLGARFLSEEDAKSAVKKFLETPFSGEDRHARRIKQIDD